MKIDLALILTVLAAVTGVIWLLDALFFAKKRRLMQAEGEEIAEPMAVDYARSLFPIILGVLVLRSFVAEPFRIPSTSMMPTLLVGDFILVNKFAYGLRLPVANTKRRGRVPVPGHGAGRPAGRAGLHQAGDRPAGRPRGVPRPDAVRQRPADPEGEGRDVRRCRPRPRDDRCDGVRGAHRSLEVSPYGDPRVEGAWEVPAGHYFVMGDNRDASADSRVWGFVPEGNLVGKAFVIWLNCEKIRNGCTTAFDYTRIGDTIR